MSGDPHRIRPASRWRLNLYLPTAIRPRNARRNLVPDLDANPFSRLSPVPDRVSPVPLQHHIVAEDRTQKRKRLRTRRLRPLAGVGCANARNSAINIAAITTTARPYLRIMAARLSHSSFTCTSVGALRTHRLYEINETSNKSNKSLYIDTITNYHADCLPDRASFEKRVSDLNGNQIGALWNEENSAS